MASSSQASFLAKQGFSMLYNATVTSVSAISTGINKAYKSYNDHYEKTQIETLKKASKPPADVLYDVLQRFYYLSMAGYNNEVAAAAQKVAAKLSAAEKCTVSFECVSAMSGVLVSTCVKYGDASSGGWGLQDFLNSSRMGKDHFDRDQLVNEFYFAVLFAQDVAGGPGAEFDKIIREAACRMVEGSSYVSESSSGYGSSGSYAPSAYQSASGLPSYAQVPAFGSGSAAPKASSSFGAASSSGLSETDPKKRAAKVLNVVSMSIKKAVDEADSRRIRSLKEAEEMLQRERQKAAQAGAPLPAATPSAYGSTSGFGGSSGFGGAAPPAASTGFGSSTYGSNSGYGSTAAKGSTGFGGATAFGGGGTGSTGGSGFGSGGSAFGAGSSTTPVSGFGSSGFGSNTGSMYGGGGGGYSSVNTNASGGSKPAQPNWMGL